MNTATRENPDESRRRRDTPASPPSCDAPADLRADLKAHADGELSARRRREIDAHLSACPACREEIAAMKKLSAALSASEPDAAAALPTGLRARLLSAADAPAADAPAAAPLWRRSPLLVFGGGGATVAASLVAFAALQSGAGRFASEEMTASAPVAVAGTPNVASEAMPASAVDVAKAVPEEKRRLAAEAVSGMTAAGARGVGVADARGVDVAGMNAPSSAADYRAGRAAGAAAGGLAYAPGEARRNEAERLPSDPFVSYRRPQATSAAASPWPSLYPASDANLVTERQVHRVASLGLEVAALEQTSERIEEMVKAGGGYVASNNLQTDSDGYKTAALSLRVPSKDFDTTMASLAKLGAVVSKSVSGEDITEKVSDAATAEDVLANDARALQAKLKTQSMSERRTGQKEAELRYLRVQLAQTRARLELLKRMASLSTIEVTLTEKAKKAAQTPPPPGFWTDLRDTNKEAARAFQSAVRVPVVLLIWVLAFTPLWVPLVIAYRYSQLKSLARAGAGARTPARPAEGESAA